MIQDFSKEELEREESARDIELTLGSGMLIILGGGLLVVCTLCFGIGYAVGHRAPADEETSNVLPAPATRSSSAPVGSGLKPAASGQAPAVPQTQGASEVPVDNPSDSTGTAQVLPAVAERSTAASQAQLRSATDSQSNGASVSPEASASSAHDAQAVPSAQGWMVQIAAVSHSEDADVLVNALRRRGYSVTARRDNADNLIHVQTGPFVNRNDANAMRQKLLSDGYNAIVQ